MNLVNGSEFQNVYSKGLTYTEYVNNLMKEDQIRKYELYYRRSILPDFVPNFFNNLNYKIIALVVGAHWCFDCQVTIPIIEKLKQASNGKFNYRLFVKEENMELLDKTNGGDKVPFVLLYSQDGYLIDRWIERPTIIYEYYGNLRSKLGWEDANFHREYRKGYLKRYKEFNHAIVDDLLGKFKRVNAIMSTSPRINKRIQIQPTLIKN